MTDYLLNDSFSGIINIVDASQLKRNVQLTVQLLELNQPIYIGLNMIDVATKRGIKIDYHKLIKKSTRIFPVVARTGKRKIIFTWRNKASRGRVSTAF